MDSLPPFILISPPVDEWWANGGQDCPGKSYHDPESPVCGPDNRLDLCMQCTYNYFQSLHGSSRPKGLSFDSYLNEYEYKPTLDRLLIGADHGCRGCRFLHEGVTSSLRGTEQAGDCHLELSTFEKYVLQWHTGGSHYCNIELFAFPAIDCSSVQLPFGSSGTQCWYRMCPRVSQHGITRMATIKWMIPRINDCLNHHKACGSGAPHYLPRRLIRVNAIPPGKRSWFNPSANLRIRLVEFPEGRKPLRYLCLSHCWGSYRPECITLKDTIENNKEDIPWKNIPKTFRDVFEVALKLEIRYVWIDSLCIIQDDKQDWEREAAKMAAIYQNAYATIAATDAGNATEGLQPSFLRLGDVAKPLPSFPGWQTRKRLPHWYTGPALRLGATRYDTVFERERTKYPLLSRAWVLQERLLSPRVIHFTNNEAVMECRQGTGCECRALPAQPDPARSIKIMLERYNDQLAALHATHESRNDHALPGSMLSIALVHLCIKWHGVVHLYMSLSITNLSDRLPAIAGLATEFLRLRRSLLTVSESCADNSSTILQPNSAKSSVLTPGITADHASPSLSNPTDVCTAMTGRIQVPDRYLLGLFSATIAVDLSWGSVRRDVSSDSCAVAGRLRGWWPTWSWISQRGEINFSAPYLTETTGPGPIGNKVLNVGEAMIVRTFVEYVDAGCAETGVMGPELVATPRENNIAWSGEGMTCGGDQGWLRLRGWVYVISWKDLPLPFASDISREPVATEGKPLFDDFLPDTEEAWALAAGRRVEDLVGDKGETQQQHRRESDETIYAVLLMCHTFGTFNWLILRCIRWTDGTVDAEGAGPVFERLGLASQMFIIDSDMTSMMDRVESGTMYFFPEPGQKMVFTLI